jgi:myo-inositol catabolism protein IolH
LKRQLDDHGLTPVADFAVYGFSEVDETTRLEAVEKWKRSIDSASLLGLDVITTELTGDPKEPEAGEKQFKKSMEVVLPLLEKANIHMSVEPHPGDFFEDGNKTVDLVREYNSPLVGYLYCTPHTFLMGTSIREMIRHAGKDLTFVHVGDSYRPERFMTQSGTGLHHHLIPGWGEVDFKETFDALWEIGYRGVISVMTFSHPDDPEGGITKTREYLLEHFGERFEA